MEDKSPVEVSAVAVAHFAVVAGWVISAVYAYYTLRGVSGLSSFTTGLPSLAALLSCLLIGAGIHLVAACALRFLRWRG